RHAEPPPDREARLVGPLQVVEREDHRSRGTHPVDGGQQPLHGGRYRPGAAQLIARVTGVEQRHDLGGPARPQAVGERAQRQQYAERVTDRAVDLTAACRRVREYAGEERRLADARLALDPDLAAAALRQRGHGLAEQVRLRTAADCRYAERGGHDAML